MKPLIVLALMALTTNALAANSELTAPVILKSGAAARIFVDGLESDDDTILITNPRIKTGAFRASVPVERLQSTGDALCAAVDSNRPFSFLNEIDVANDSLIPLLNDKQVANLELQNGTLIAELIPVESGRWVYTYKSLGCSRQRIETSGE